MKGFICQCKAVRYNDIIRSIRHHGALTLLDLQNLTKVSTGCGRCKLNVNEILNKELKAIRRKGQQLRLDF